MITLIHGDDTAKSREYYISERSRYPEKIILDGTTLTITDLIQATSNNGLFGNQRLIFIEDLFSKRKPSKELDEIVNAIRESEQEIFLYESKELISKQLKPFENSKIKHFPIPKTIFAFLESLSPGNGKKSISLFHELLKTQDPNFALFMLQRQVRILLAISSTLSPTLSELSRLAPWQKSKLEKQAKLFSLDQLLNLHEQLYQLELATKIGQLSQPLDQAIDFLLLSI